MSKKEKQSKKKKEEELSKKEEPKEDRAGFPEGIDFKKFLGCGG